MTQIYTLDFEQVVGLSAEIAADYVASFPYEKQEAAIDLVIERWLMLPALQDYSDEDQIELTKIFIMRAVELIWLNGEAAGTA